MNSAEVVDQLDRLLQTLCRSLPMYLQEAKPWVRHDNDPIEEALACVASDQKAFAGRVADAIVEWGGRPDPGCFPIAFVAINDASADFLLQRAVQCHQQDTAAIKECADGLREVPLLHSLAEEIHGNAQGHLDTLQRLQAGEAASA